MPASLRPPTPPAVPTAPITPVRPEVVDTRRQIEEATKNIEAVKAQVGEKEEILGRAQEWMRLTGAKATDIIPEWVIAARTPEEVAALVKPKRIEELERLAFAPPERSWEEIFTEAYEKAGMAGTKKKIDDLDAKILKTKQDLYTAEADINSFN